jgi:glycerophosphoryl diester phosphodiesterase
MLAFEKAIEAGFDGIETDVQMTKDGVLVLLHDNKINRTSNGKGRLLDMTYQELLQYNFNNGFKEEVKIPRLDELLALIKGTKLILDLEIKDIKTPSMAHDTAMMVKDYGVEDQVYFSSVSLERMVEIKRYLPQNYCALILNRDYKKRKEEPVIFHLDGIHANFKYLKEKELIYYQEHHIEMGAWTITKQKDYDFFKQKDILFAITNEKMK